MSLRLLKTSAVLAIGCMLSPADAHAYIDPASGSYVLQLVAAAGFALLYVISTSWSRVKCFFSRLFAKGEREKDGES